MHTHRAMYFETNRLRIRETNRRGWTREELSYRYFFCYLVLLSFSFSFLFPFRSTPHSCSSVALMLEIAAVLSFSSLTNPQPPDPPLSPHLRHLPCLFVARGKAAGRDKEAAHLRHNQRAGGRRPHSQDLKEHCAMGVCLHGDALFLCPCLRPQRPIRNSGASMCGVRYEWPSAAVQTCTGIITKMGKQTLDAIVFDGVRFALLVLPLRYFKQQGP